MTLDLQKVFDSLRITFFKSCPGAESHFYGTRRALGKLATLSTNPETRTSSVSSCESMASSSLSHGQPPQRRNPKRGVSKASRSRQTRSTGYDYQNWSDGDDLINEDDDRGRSISVDVSVSSEEIVVPHSSASRRQTRSMAKTTGGHREGGGRKALPVPSVPCSKKNGFGMTLRTRGTKRHLDQDSSSDEESDSEAEENKEEEESESDNLSLDVEQEEEEEYEEEEEEEEGVEHEVHMLRTRSDHLRSQGAGKSPRKRQRKMSSDSDEDLTYKPSNFLARSSRSGRVVKANTKYS